MITEPPDDDYAPCKHMRKHFSLKPESEPLELIHKGSFRPVLPEEARPKVSSSASMLIDAYAFNVTAGEVAYWQHKQAQEA